jgi:hypothetical protein
MVQRHQMQVGWPLRFSDGERIIAVLSSQLSARSVAEGTNTEIQVTVLVEMPADYDPEEMTRREGGREQ